MKATQPRFYYGSFLHISRTKYNWLPLAIMPFIYLYRRLRYVLLILILMLVALNFNYHSQVKDAWQRGADSVLGTIYSQFTISKEWSYSLQNSWRAHWLAATHNNYLIMENSELRSKQRQLELLQDENVFLKQQLRFVEQGEANFITARILLSKKSVIDHNFLLNVGTELGVKSSMAVLNADGLLGRVISVTASTARVLAITDLHSRIPAILAKSRINCIVAGTTAFGELELLYLPENFVPVEGEYVITAAQEEGLPYGIKIADVQHKNGAVIAVPASSWLKGDFVQVQFNKN